MVQGENGLHYKAEFDINEFKKNGEAMLRMFKQIQAEGEKAFNFKAGSGNTFDPKPITTFREAQLRMQETLRNARLETERLKQEQQNLSNELAQGKIVQQAYRTETARLAAEQAALRAATLAARGAQTAASGSYREAQERLKALGLEIRNTTGGFNAQGAAQRARIDEYRRLNAELTAFDRTMGNHGRNVGNYSSALQGVGKNLAGLAAGYLTAQAALAGLTSVIRTNAEISDSLSNVQRTAGLTAKEAENLAEQLKKIDTRTSLKGLIDISVIGGQLGIAGGQLGGFTKAIDQLAVALGGELQGGAEGVAKSLGVLDNVFKVTQANGGDVERSFNQIGSAILGLGQSGLATGDFLADFGERVGGVAKQAGLSLPFILSYGAVLQENGVSAEVAGTSFKKLISLMATRRTDFFAVAQIADSNLTLQDFTNTINTDTQKALELFFNGLQKGGTKTTAFLDILKSSGLAMGGVSQTVAALSANQVALNTHIADSTRDFNDATKSAEQFAIKNDNLAASMEKFSNTVSNMVTDGGLSTFFKQGIDGAREFVVYLDKLVNSQSWREFGVRLTGGNAANFDKANGLKAGLEKNSALAFTNSNTPNLYKQDAEALRKSFSVTKDAAIDATVKYNTFKNAIVKGTLKDDGSLNAYKQNSEILVKQANDLARAYVQARDKAAKNRKPASEGSDFILPGDAKVAKAAEHAAKVAAAKSVHEAEALGDHLSKLIAESSSASMTADQKEVESVRAKYKAMTDEATKFYNDPKNAGKKVVVNGQNFSKGQVFGSIKSGQDAELKAIDKKNADEAAKIEQKKYDDLVAQFISYADKRKKAEFEYNADMITLAKNPAAQAERKAVFDQQLQDEADTQAKSLDAFEQLFKGIDRLSDENARKVVSNAEVMLNSLLASGKISKELAAEIRALLSNTTKEISNRMPERIINLANQIDQVAAAVSEVDAGFGKMLSTVGNVVGQVGNIKKGILDLKDAQGLGKNGMDDFSSIGQLTAGLGIFGAGLSIVSGITKLFDRSAAREGQAAYSRDLQNKQTEAMNKALERQIDLIDEAYGTERIAKYNAAIAQATADQVKYQKMLDGRYSKTGDASLDKQLEKYNETGDKSLLGFVKNIEVLDKFKLPTGIKELRDLLESGKLDAGTAIIVENLIRAQEAAKDLENQMNSDNIGSSLDSITDDFIGALTDGTQDFGKTFEDTIRTSILNGFKGKIIQEQLQGFYDDFAKATADNNLTEAEIAALRQTYIAASEQSKKDLEALEKATGVDLSGGASDNSSAVNRNIKQITSDQANALEGIMRGSFEQQRLVAANTNLLSPMNRTVGDMFECAKQRLAYQAQIATNTANTVQRLDMAVTELKAINKNTGGNGDRLRDGGFGG